MHGLQHPLIIVWTQLYVLWYSVPKVSHNTVGIFLPQELFCYDGQGTIPYLLYYTIVPYYAYVHSDTVSPHIVAPSFNKSFHLYVYSSAYVHVVITSTWHMTCRLVNVSYLYLTELCFHENCQLMVIISCIWDVAILLCFCGASGGSTLFTLGNPYIMELLRWLNICVDIGVPSFGCAVHFNPWYKNFMWGLCSCEY